MDNQTIFFFWPYLRQNSSEEPRGVASLAVTGGQNFHFPNFSSIYISFSYIFQTFLIFVFILALLVGELPKQEGPGYATEGT